jgi:hypothetical protein
MSTFSKRFSADSMSIQKRCVTDGRQLSIRSVPSKPGMGATYLPTKTLPRVATEMALHLLGYNLTRVMNIIEVQPLRAAMRT